MISVIEHLVNYAYACLHFGIAVFILIICVNSFPLSYLLIVIFDRHWFLKSI